MGANPDRLLFSFHLFCRRSLNRLLAEMQHFRLSMNNWLLGFAAWCKTSLRNAESGKMSRSVTKKLFLAFGRCKPSSIRSPLRGWPQNWLRVFVGTRKIVDWKKREKKVRKWKTSDLASKEIINVWNFRNLAFIKETKTFFDHCQKICPRPAKEFL